MYHRTNSGYGENIYMCSASSPAYLKVNIWVHCWNSKHLSLRSHSIMVRASVLLSDYVLMDPGSNPHQVNLFIYLNRN